MPIRVATFNIRCGVAEDGVNHWRFRREFAAEVIREVGADVIGLQECYGFQKDDLTPLLPGYGWAGVGREDGAAKGEMCAVLWRTDRWESREVGHFWLSETPEVAGSMSWATACCRMATWVRLRDRASGERFTVLNTHMDHVSMLAREQGAALIARRLSAADGPAVILGDFNCLETHPPYRVLREAGWTDAWREVFPAGTRDEGTFHAFAGHATGERIDWILRSRHLTTRAAGMDTRSRSGQWPSDHHMVWAELEFVTPPAP